MIDFWTEVRKPEATVLDFGTLVPYEDVAHCFDPSHQPRYTVESSERDLLASFDTDVLAAVKYTHEARVGYVVLLEDDWPVYECLS